MKNYVKNYYENNNFELISINKFDKEKNETIFKI